MDTRTGPAPLRLPAPTGIPGEELHSTLKHKYDLVPDVVRIRDRHFTLYRVRDVNALIDSLDAGTLSDADRFPYWAQLWDSSIALAEWCLSSPDLAGCTVLELGSGLGLAGIAAAAAGATVTLSDYDPDALMCAQLNILRNLSPSERLRASVTHRDWRSQQEEVKRFDFVIGADILYDRAVARHLLDLVRSAITPGGSIVLADPDRATGRSFLAWAAEEGLQVSSETRMITQNGTRSRITVATLREEHHD